jgi:hypothetical protein
MEILGEMMGKVNEKKPIPKQKKNWLGTDWKR